VQELPSDDPAAEDPLAMQERAGDVPLKGGPDIPAVHDGCFHLAQLHECATPIGKFFGSAERLGARAQGVVIVNARRETAAADRQFSCVRSAEEDVWISR
jgi:hypothetical protein